VYASIDAISRATGGTVTVTTLAPHGRSIGDQVSVEGVADAGFCGLFTVATVPAPAAFTCAQDGAEAASSGGAVTGSTALAYAFKSQSWTRFTAMPGGCGRFACTAATLGWYAADTWNENGNGCLFRMMSGETDDGSTFANAAIPFAWYSKVYTAPDPRVYKQVGEVRAVLSIDEPLSALTLALRANGAPTDTAAKDAVIEAAPERMGEARWLPARQPDVTRWQVGLRGSSSTGRAGAGAGTAAVAAGAVAGSAGTGAAVTSTASGAAGSGSASAGAGVTRSAPRCTSALAVGSWAAVVGPVGVSAVGVGSVAFMSGPLGCGGSGPRRRSGRPGPWGRVQSLQSFNPRLVRV
jgi:hypothetical protein